MAPRGLVPRPLSLLSPQGEVAGLAARARIPAGIGSQMKSSDHSPGSKVWEEAVERFGKAVALDAGGCSLAFEDLDRRSRLVAEALCAKPEWRPGLRIGVETSRVDFFVEALGVWIAGGVLVPYCAAHLEADARLAGLVNALVEGIPGGECWTPGQSFDGERDWHAIYFTSGSTGEPKAVVRGWRQALHEAECYAKTVGLSPGIRCSMLVDPVFGASTKHFLGSLLAGCSQASVSMAQKGNSVW